MNVDLLVCENCKKIVRKYYSEDNMYVNYESTDPMPEMIAFWNNSGTKCDLCGHNTPTEIDTILDIEFEDLQPLLIDLEVIRDKIDKIKKRNFGIK